MPPVAPLHAGETPDFPLKRSGLDVRELFNTPDQVVVRSPTPAAALELGLEHARGSMVRNQPADALAALDEVWSAARHTETGWYLRAGSLALLGLPGEAARVVADGLRAKPHSFANFFLQALTSWALGDLATAQASLANAMSEGESDALVVIQQALFAAQHGDITQAEELLRRAATTWPDHPALAYGRDTMRVILRNKTRDTPRTPGASNTPGLLEALFDDDVNAVSVETENRTHRNEETSGAGNRDVVTDSLAELGRALANGTRRQALDSTRSLLSSLSAGGTLVTSMPAARSYAARAALRAILEALTNSSTISEFGWEAESIDGHWQRSTPAWSANVRTSEINEPDSKLLLNTVRVLLIAMREGRAADALQQVRGARGSVSELSLQVLREIIGDDALASADGAEQAATYVRNRSPGHFMLPPLRLGLALLPEREVSGAQLRSTVVADASVTYAGALGALSGYVHGAGRRGESGGPTALPAALALLAVAALAFSLSLPIVGIMCAGAGGWVALRKGTRAP